MTILDAHQFDTMTHSAIYAEERAYPVSNINPECSQRISEKYFIPLEILGSVRLAEGGYPGHIRKNSDASYDVGPMQINTVNWKYINQSLGFTPIEIRFDGCKNLEAGALLLRKHLDKSRDEIKGWPDVIRVIANYHSATPTHNIKYQHIVASKLNAIVKDFPRSTRIRFSEEKS